MWWLGLETNNNELRTATFFFTLVTLLGLHIALITEIIRKEFSYYHTCIALQFIALYTLLCNAHFGLVDGLARHKVGLVGFSILFALVVGELCYASVATASVIRVAKMCSSEYQEIEGVCKLCDKWDTRISGFILVHHNWIVVILSHLIIVWSNYLVATASHRILNSKLVRFGVFYTILFFSSTTIFVVFQMKIVGHFQKYMDSSENTWSFGQIVAMVAPFALLFELYRQGTAKAEDAAETRWRSWIAPGTLHGFALYDADE